MLKTIGALIVAILMAVVGWHYSRLAIIGESQPLFATWLLFCLGANLSYLTYRATPGEKTLVNNIANLVDVAVVWVVLAVIVCVPQTRWDFTPFELACFIACAIIFYRWRTTKQHTVANLCLQAIMSVAYFPTLSQLATAEVNTEPLAVWVMCWSASLISLGLARHGQDRLAQVYAGRALFFVTLMLVLIIRLELR